MNAKVLEHLLSVLLACAWLLSGCSGAPAIAPGDVLPLQPGTTLVNTFSALQGLNPFAKALTNGNGTYLLAWPGPGNGVWSAVCLNVSCPHWMANFRSVSGTQGMVIRDTDISALVKAALASGWRYVSVTSIVNPGLVTPAVFPLFPELMPEGVPQT